MRLIDVCEPILLYLSSLRRAARRAGDLQASAVRSAIKGIFAQVRAAAAADIGIETQYDEVELPLIFFVDLLIAESGFDFAQDWEPLGYERNELAGDQKFFEMLKETLADDSDEAAERLVVYHACLGLGFSGKQADGMGTSETYISLLGDGEGDLLKLRRKVYARVRKTMEVEAAEYMCPEAYDHVDRSNLVEATGRKLGAMAVALVGLICLLVIANFVLFRWTSTAVSTALGKIGGRAGTPVERVEPEPDRERSTR
ncbi:MAG: DotU family type IV/VI secretion system protein [Planctomycetota bacterium]|jgi:type VI protein secretion system component VasF